MMERQEIWCHACSMYVQFDMDMELNGNHVLHCPNCGHEHCRVVKDGIITDDRWDQRNGNTYAVSSTSSTFSTTSVTMTCYTASTATGTGAYFLAGSWMNTTTS